jgi:hypothetical protein
VEGIKIRRFIRIRKYIKIKIQPLCGEYPSWVFYLSFKEEDCGSFLCIILVWMWLGKFFLGKKCVCHIGDKGGKYGSILNFDSCNGKMVENISYCFVLLGGC